MSFFSYGLLTKGGIIMVPIILLSIAGWAAALERLWKIFRLPKPDDVKNFAAQILEFTGQGQILKAETECLKFDHPIARVFKEGLRMREAEKDDIKTSMERVANGEVRSLEKNFGLLVTVVGVSPMLGFLGTIVGLIRAFMSWEQMAENVTVSALAAGIYQAMLTTAAGLAVAVPLYILYQVLVSRVRKVTHEMADLGDELILQLTYGAKEKAGR